MDDQSLAKYFLKCLPFLSTNQVILKLTIVIIIIMTVITDLPADCFHNRWSFCQ